MGYSKNRYLKWMGYYLEIREMLFSFTLNIIKMMFPLPEDAKKLGKAYTIWYTVMLYLAFAYFVLTVGVLFYLVGINFYSILSLVLKVWVIGGLLVYFLLKFVKRK